MTTLYPTGLDTTTQLPNDQTDETLLNRAGTDHSQEHVNLSDAVRAIEAELGIAPSGASATVTARFATVPSLAAANTWTGAPQTIGTGDNVGLFSIWNQVPTLLDIRRGTAASPDTTLGPAAKVSRTVAITRAQINAVQSGSDGVSSTAAISGHAHGPATAEVQTVGVIGTADNASTTSPDRADAIGIYGIGRLLSTQTVAGVGLGGFFQGRRDVDTVNAVGIEVQSANYTVTDDAWNPTGTSDTRGIWMPASGTADSAVGIAIANQFGNQFDVGIGFTGYVADGVTGAIKSSSIRDDSAAPVSLDIRGTHATAAISVASGSGAAVIGAATPAEAQVLLEVKPSAGANPAVRFGNAAVAGAYTARFINPTNSVIVGIAGGATVFTNASVGDALLATTGVTKKVLLGRDGSASDIAVGGGVGFYGTAPVAQQTGVAVTAAGIHAALVNLGLITA